MLTGLQGLTHWGNTTIRGRGLVALAGAGQIYQITLKAGEQYVAHPRCVELLLFARRHITDHFLHQQRPRILHHPGLTTTIPLPLNDASPSTPQSDISFLDEVLPRNAQDYNLQVVRQRHLHSTDVGSTNDMGRSSMCINHSVRCTGTDPVRSSSSHSKDQAQSCFSHEAHGSGMF